jgi:hypothetical protein
MNRLRFRLAMCNSITALLAKKCAAMSVWNKYSYLEIIYGSCALLSGAARYAVMLCNMMAALLGKSRVAILIWVKYSHLLIFGESRLLLCGAARRAENFSYNGSNEALCTR